MHECPACGGSADVIVPAGGRYDAESGRVEVTPEPYFMLAEHDIPGTTNRCRAGWGDKEFKAESERRSR